MVAINCEFAGGLQALFDDKTKLSLEVTQGSTIHDLVLCLKKNYLRKSPEMFVNDKDKL